MISCTLSIVCSFCALVGQKCSLFSLSLVLGNWYRQGKERKRDSIFSALKAPTVVLAHGICICTLTCSVLEGENVNRISLLACSHFLYTALKIIGVKKKWWDRGIHCGPELIMESFFLLIFFFWQPN